MRKSKAKLASENSSISNVSIACGWCNTSSEYTFDEITIIANETPCELCGSHGDVEVDCKCKKCGKLVEVTVKSW